MKGLLQNFTVDLGLMEDTPDNHIVELWKQLLLHKVLRPEAILLVVQVQGVEPLI